MRIPHIIKAEQFNRPFIEDLFQLTSDIERRIGGKYGIYSTALNGKILATLFYEESTRTRFSFEAAVLKLGGNYISTENAREFSSAVKGESLEDTVKVVGGYVDVIALRHFDNGSSERAARVSPVPIINGGDGSGEHPTQALLDLYTIKRELGSIDGATIALVNDLAFSRTIHSLSKLLACFTPKKIWLVSPPMVKMPDGIKDYLRKHTVLFEEISHLLPIAEELDVVYQTRVQTNHIRSKGLAYRARGEQIVIDSKILRCMKPTARILHPQPINNEIVRSEVDKDLRAAYFRQAQNGLYVRMALLYTMFRAPHAVPSFIPA